jgi:hypothetical protein
MLGGGKSKMKGDERMKIVSLIVGILLMAGDAFAQGQQTPLTKEQIVERVQQIDRQLLMLEKQDLVKAYQELEKKEKAAKEKAEPKKEDKKK